MNFLSLTTALCFGSIYLLSNGAFAQKITDDQLKQNVNPIINSVEKINQLKPVSYNYNTALTQLKLPAGQQFGFLDTNMQQVFPGMIKAEGKFIPAGKNAFKTLEINTVDLVSLIPFLVGSIKEQQAEIEKLKSEIRLLKTNAQVITK